MPYSGAVPALQQSISCFVKERWETVLLTRSSALLADDDPPLYISGLSLCVIMSNARLWTLLWSWRCQDPRLLEYGGEEAAGTSLAAGRSRGSGKYSWSFFLCPRPKWANIPCSRACQELGFKVILNREVLIDIIYSHKLYISCH